MDQMPHAELAFVEERKITGYLLSTDHPRGRPKAAFFVSFGFWLEAWQRLEEALMRHAREGEVVEEETSFGGQYALEGPPRTPDARNPLVCTVWLIETGRQRPRFVTAYPGREGGESG